MQYSILIDAGCTVDAVPYKVLDLEASKLNFVGPEMKFTPVMAVLLVLENAPVGVVPFVFPTGWNVPVMFGPNITGTFTEHGNTSEMKCTGAFTGEARIGLGSNSGGARDGGRVTMNSSRSSSVYGSSSVVQPSSARLLFCIKS